MSDAGLMAFRSAIPMVPSTLFPIGAPDGSFLVILLFIGPVSVAFFGAGQAVH